MKNAPLPDGHTRVQAAFVHHRTLQVALVGTLTTEQRLLNQLITILRQQREAAIAGDLMSVEESAYAVHRVLLTMREVKCKHDLLTRLLGGEEEQEGALTDPASPSHLAGELRAGREAVRAAALSLARAAGANELVLRRAMPDGDTARVALRLLRPCHLHLIAGGCAHEGGPVPHR